MLSGLWDWAQHRHPHQGPHTATLAWDRSIMTTWRDHSQAAKMVCVGTAEALLPDG